MSRAPSPLHTVLVAWLVPGGGHFLLGRRTQAAFFFLTITITFVFGMYLSDFGNVSPSRHEYYFLTHVLNGGEALVAGVLTSGMVEDQVPRHFGFPSNDIGTLYSAVAGLLNAIVVMDALGLAAGLSPDPEPEEQEPTV